MHHPRTCSTTIASSSRNHLDDGQLAEWRGGLEGRPVGEGHPVVRVRDAAVQEGEACRVALAGEVEISERRVGEDGHG